MIFNSVEQVFEHLPCVRLRLCRGPMRHTALQTVELHFRDTYHICIIYVHIIQWVLAFWNSSNFFFSCFVCPSDHSHSNSLASSGLYRIYVSSHLHICISELKKIQYRISVCTPQNANFTFDKFSILISLAHGFTLKLPWF